MHEMALAEGVLGIVEDYARQAGAERVRVIRLEIGKLSHVSPEALSFAFMAVSAGSLADGAKLEIDRAPGKAWCHDCTAEVEIEALGDLCPRCGGSLLQVTSGEELRVKEMEVA